MEELSERELRIWLRAVVRRYAEMKARSWSTPLPANDLAADCNVIPFPRPDHHIARRSVAFDG